MIPSPRDFFYARLIPKDEDIMETGRMLTCKQARLELEASSSNISNSTQKDLSIMDVDTMETGRILSRKQARLEFEAGSSSNHNISKKDLSVIVSPLHESSSVQLEAHYDMVPGTKHCDLNLSSLPKRKPCYGWISEDED